MREALAAAAKSIRRLHNLPSGYHTPDRSARIRSKEEAGSDKEALERKLQQLQSQIQMPQVFATCATCAAIA